MKRHPKFSAAGRIPGVLVFLVAPGLFCACADMRGSERGTVESSMNKAAKRARGERLAPAPMNVNRIRIT